VAPLVLVLCDVADPGNAGTLLRFGEAAGAAAVVVCGPAAVDVYNPKVVRAAAGSLFRVPVVVAAAAEPVLDDLARHGLARVATVIGPHPAYDDVELRGPVALVLGSEAHGLAPALLAHVDHTVTIPMHGAVESLNVAVAGAVLAFEAARQRRRHG
jgi:TrmH family RNA methyltransferase